MALRMIVALMALVAIVVFVALVVEIITTSHQVTVGDIVTDHPNCSQVHVYHGSIFSSPNPYLSCVLCVVSKIVKFP